MVATTATLLSERAYTGEGQGVGQPRDRIGSRSIGAGAPGELASRERAEVHRRSRETRSRANTPGFPLSSGGGDVAGLTVAPGGVFVVERAGSEASVEDADEAVAEGLGVGGAVGFPLVVERATSDAGVE